MAILAIIVQNEEGDNGKDDSTSRNHAFSDVFKVFIMLILMIIMMKVAIVVMMKVAMKATAHSDLFVFVGTNFFRLKDHFGTCPLTCPLIQR